MNDGQCRVILPGISTPSMNSPTYTHASVTSSIWSLQYWKDWYNSASLKSSPKNRHKKLVVVGCHGWQVFGGVFSDPDLVSKSFTQFMVDAMPDTYDQVVQVQVSGVGGVEARIKSYLTLQLDIATYSDATHVILIGHSQGALVALGIAHHLLSHQLLNESTKVSVLCMGGVHHGPFIDLIVSDFFSATRELFLFAQPWLGISRRRRRTLEYVLDSGASVMCIAAWKDQVVPLYSALALGAHEYLSRTSDKKYNGIVSSNESSLRSGLIRSLFIPPDTDEGFLGRFVVFLMGIVNSSSHSSPREMLVCLSGYIRGSVLDRSGTHSLIHTFPEVYQEAANVFLGKFTTQETLKSGANTNVSLVNHSNMLGEAFTISPQNGYLIELHAAHIREWILETSCWYPELESISLEYSVWSPKGTQMKALRKSLAPLFLTPISKL